VFFLQRTITDRWQFVKIVLSQEASTIASIVFIGILSNRLKSFIANSVQPASTDQCPMADSIVKSKTFDLACNPNAGLRYTRML
jgi:hypothetical protein